MNLKNFTESIISKIKISAQNRQLHSHKFLKILTCMGVPVRHHRRPATKAAAAIEIWLLEDFMVCASSRTTLNQLTE